jgi:hypothetical protein
VPPDGNEEGQGQEERPREEARRVAHAKGIAAAPPCVNGGCSRRAPSSLAPTVTGPYPCASASSAVISGFSKLTPSASVMTPKREVLSTTPRFPGAIPAPWIVTGTKPAE